MDPAQNPPQTQNTNNDTQAAMKRGDIPMQLDTSQKIIAATENETLSKMNVVANAQNLNLQNTAKETSQTGSNTISDNGKSKDQIRELSEKVEKANLPKDLEDILTDRISRLELIRQGSGFMSSTFVIEYEQASRYVDWVVKMPWEAESEDLLDLSKAKEIMDKNHYGLEPLKQRVLEYIASLMLNIKNNKNTDNIVKAPILCVLGLAGTGKTTFAKSIADALGRSFERIAFGGMADSRVLRGQSRFFPDAEPGAIIKKMVHGKTKNPVICLDELDRVTDTARADIMGVLIEVLDPEQNTNFIDHYIDYPFSLQKVIFIGTANNLSSVATAVLDRLEIINMPSYNDEEKIMIGKKFLLPKSMKTTGLLPNQLQIDDPVWEPLVRPLGYDPGIRGLDRLITNMCRRAAVLIISGQTETVRITVDNVKQFTPEW
jgi:ATP-dependent Lon protease